MAGKSTLNRLELGKPEPTPYHKIGHDPRAIENLLIDLFVEAHARPPRHIILDLDATDDPLHGHQEGRFFHGYYDCYCYLALHLLRPAPLGGQTAPFQHRRRRRGGRGGGR